MHFCFLQFKAVDESYKYDFIAIFFCDCYTIGNNLINEISLINYEE